MTSPIKTGDPQLESASFSRFVLPFAYQQKVLARTSDVEALHYASADQEDWIHDAAKGRKDTDRALDAARRCYLTFKTVDVLFERAHWFVLRSKSGASRSPAWLEFTLKSLSRDKLYQVALRHPAIVLFEWDQNSALASGRVEILKTGFLVIEAYFPGGADDSPTEADFLRFQELFRYCKRPWNGHDLENPGENPENPELHAFGRAFEAALGSHTTIPDGCGCTQNRSLREPDFLYECRWSHLLNIPIRFNDGGGVSLTFPGTGWMVTADTRSYVQSCLLMPRSPVFSNLETWGRTGKPPEPANADGSDPLGLWIKLLNIDDPGRDPQRTLQQCTAFEREWMLPRTYRRWLHYETVYGFTIHSMVMLSKPPGAGVPPTWLHFGQMYFDQLLLMLYVRVMLFRFSRQLSDISRRAVEKERVGEGDLWDERDEFNALRRMFDWFTNLYQFPLLSTQQQAIEMYALLYQELDIENIYSEVENEVDGTHEVLELESAGELNRIALVIGIAGVVSMFVGVAQTVLTFSQMNGDYWLWWFGATFISLLSLVVAGIATYWREGLAGRLSKFRARKSKSRSR